VKGPHNIWRLVRTGATFERTGAMGAVLEAMDAPPAVRVAARVLGGRSSGWACAAIRRCRRCRAR
jgi:hypothetical protein